MQCSVPGCTNERQRVNSGRGRIAYRSACAFHRSERERKTERVVEYRQRPGRGDPNVSSGGYKSAHAKVFRHRGPASQHPCEVCGSEAREWSYTHDDPDEVVECVGGYDKPFSRNTAFYVPVCIPCHRRLDKRVKKEKVSSLTPT